MADVMLAVLLIVAVVVLLFGLARYVGLGRCLDCGRGCPPWSAYCWRHSPDAGDDR